jgi:hypothetical protein
MSGMALAPSGSEPSLYGNPDWVGSEYEKTPCRGVSRKTGAACSAPSVAGSEFCVGHGRGAHKKDE